MAKLTGKGRDGLPKSMFGEPEQPKAPAKAPSASPRTPAKAKAPVKTGWAAPKKK